MRKNSEISTISQMPRVTDKFLSDVNHGIGVWHWLPGNIRKSASTNWCVTFVICTKRTSGVRTFTPQCSACNAFLPVMITRT